MPKRGDELQYENDLEEITTKSFLFTNPIEKGKERGGEEGQ